MNPLSVLPAFLATACLIWLPGAAGARLLRVHRTRDWPQQFAVEFGFGLALWPVLFLWTSTLSWRWNSFSVSQFVAVLSIAGVLSLTLRSREVWRSRIRYLRRNAVWLAGWCGLMALAVASRLHHVRGMVLPAWIDPVHHTMIVRLLVEQGRVPSSLDPYIPNGDMFYHWGFHILIAWLAWLSHRTAAFDIAADLLIYGQILNAASIFTLYALGRYLFHSRLAGMYAAVLGAFVSWLPAYYTSWGRYPHLVGTLLLPVLILALLRLARRKDFHSWLATVLLASGLVLIHVRVSFLAMLLGVLVLAGFLAKKDWKAAALGASAGAAALLAVLPWLLALAHGNRAQTMLAVSTDKEVFWSAFNAIPWQLVWIPNNSLLLSLATAGLSGIAGVGQPPLNVRILSVAWTAILTASLIIWTRRRHGFTAQAILPVAALLVSWCAVVGILVNLDTFGIPSLGFIHNSSVVITLFLPLALLGGALIGFAVSCLSHPRYSPLVAVLVGLTVAIWGAGQMRDIINPKTVLVQPADLEAMEWVRQNTDEDAAIAINVSQWQGRTYAGSDAGYWLGVLTGRRSILPPALYATALPSDQAARLNALMQEWNAFDSVDSPEAQQLLEDEGIDYIFVGGAGGHLDGRKLEQSPFVDTVYARNDTRVFKLKD